MHSMNVMFAYLAPPPFLPMTSVLAIMVGVVLMFGRNMLGLVTRWVRLATVRRTRGADIKGPHFRPGGRVTDVAKPVAAGR